MEVNFTVNGIKRTIKSGDMAFDTTLNTYLRSHLCLTGTKFMCQEAGCGCCIVTIRGIQPVTGESFTLAVNSCVFLVYSCHGLDITTIEGIGDKKKGYHPIQESLAQHDGTQCGYCSPGFVMNMYSLYEGKFGNVTAEEVEDSFGGNICRCTGYRPILDAFKSFATNPPQNTMTNLCADIEDLTLKKCPKTGKSCAGKCGGSLHLKATDNAEWYKVNTLAEVLQILNNIGTKKYRLVGGNTATGIYRIPYDIEVFIDMSSVSELRRYSISTTVSLGGNIQITEFMRILLEAADSSTWYTYCRQIRDHLNLIANVPVRNVGTIAGNLMTKHDFPEFSSDIFLLLETIGGMLTIVDSSGNQIYVSPQAFLGVDMNKKVITKIDMPQLVPGAQILRSYKITDRAQTPITYMNAAFLFQMRPGSNIVATSRIVYGGVNPSFVHATAVENYLIGKDLFDNATIEGVVNLINSTFVFDDSLPNPSAEFLRRLAIGLFFKTILNLAPAGRVRPTYQSGSYLISRPLSSGIQNYQTIPLNYPLTQPIMKVEALVQCSGEAEYVNDMKLLNALWATFVLATEPLKTIASIDTTDALAVKGVKAFYGADKIPGVNSFIVTKGPPVPSYPNPEELFCSGKVLFHGQPVGVIVAEEMSQAVYAAGIVKIQYTNNVADEVSLADSLIRYFKGNTSTPKEKILPTLEDVLREDPKLTEHRFQIPIVVHAATQTGLAQSSTNLKGTLLCGPQYHYHMETQQTIAVPVDDGMDIFPSTQWMDLTNMGVANVLGVENCKINIFVRRAGGAFGAKISRSVQISAAAAVACFHEHRPIRMITNMKNNMRAIGKRTPAFTEYDVDVNDQGVILRLNADVTHDLGCSNNESMEFYASLFASNAYLTLTWTIVFHHVLTEAPSNTWMRAPGSTEVIANAETIMEHIAYTLKKDPIEVRLANIAIVSPMRKIFTDFVTSCEYYNRLNDVNIFNTNNRWKKRGISISIMQFPQFFSGTFESLVAINQGDGSVVITIGGIEVGQGINTNCTQIAAAILKIPLELIKVKPSNNVISANTVSTAGSMTGDAVGFSVKVCCETLSLRLAPFRLVATWENAVHTAYLANIELIAIHQFSPVDMLPYLSYGAACAEIEIDVLTGDFQLRRVDIVTDVGTSINPKLDVGQVEGGFIMGLGYWVYEKLVYNRQNGELLTDRAWNYKPPGAKDIPVDFRVTLLQTISGSAGVVGSKSCSESATSLAVVAVGALRKALESARKDAQAPDIFLTLNSSTTKEEILVLAGTKNARRPNFFTLVFTPFDKDFVAISDGVPLHIAIKPSLTKRNLHFSQISIQEDCLVVGGSPPYLKYLEFIDKDIHVNHLRGRTLIVTERKIQKTTSHSLRKASSVGSRRPGDPEASFDDALSDVKTQSKSKSISNFHPLGSSSSLSNVKYVQQSGLVDVLKEFMANGIPNARSLYTCNHPDFQDALNYLGNPHTSWCDFVNYEQLSDLQKHIQSRMWEIVTTEVKHIFALQTVTDHFLACLTALQDREMLPEINKRKLFSNIVEICEANLTFWATFLFPMVQHSVQSGEPLDMGILEPGFLSFADIFGPYKTYCSNQTSCLNYCRHLTRTNIFFGAYLQWCESHEFCKRLKLADILVAPMQRLTKYKLILKTIQDDMGGNKLIDNLDEMIDSVGNFVSSVDLSLSDMQALERLRGVMARIDGYDVVEKSGDTLDCMAKQYSSMFDLCDPIEGCAVETRRHLFMEGDLKFKDSTGKFDVHCFLLTDILLVCRINTKKTQGELKVCRTPILTDRLKIMLKDETVYCVYLNEFGLSSTAFSLQCSEAKSWYDAMEKARQLFTRLKHGYRPSSDGSRCTPNIKHSPRSAGSSQSGSMELSEIKTTLVDVERENSVSSEEGVMGIKPKLLNLPKRSSSKVGSPILFEVKQTDDSRGQSMPDLYSSFISQTQSNTLLVPGMTTTHGSLLSTHRGISYPPPSPTRATLRRGLAFSFTNKNPPLVKTKNVTSQNNPEPSASHGVHRVQQVIRIENEDVDVNQQTLKVNDENQPPIHPEISQEREHEQSLSLGHSPRQGSSSSSISIEYIDALGMESTV